MAFRVQGKIDHHDAVLFNDADEQNGADERDDIKIHAAQDQRDQSADAGGRQGGKYRDRVNVALIKHAENDIDRNQRRED